MKRQQRRKIGHGKRPANVVVRLTPELRYLAELCARQQRRTVSSFVEWAIERALYEVELDRSDDPLMGHSVGELRHQLWDVNEPERFAILASHYRGLLTHEEQVLWKLITTIPYFGCRGGGDLDEIALRVRLPNWWDTLRKVARGELPESVLSALEDSTAATAEMPNDGAGQGDNNG